MNAKESLLDKYSIPIEHLDFEYLRTCQNVRELEKIIEILKSGEEGYYPDLTKFAEEKLRELDPDNRVLRVEVKCLSTGMNERQEINQFIREIKDKDAKLRLDTGQGNNEDDELPPVRTAKKSANVTDSFKTTKSKSKRIASSDYNQWEKYDADTECLKIDLQEEQIRERSYIEQKKRQQNRHTLIEVLSEETIHCDMSQIERHEFADKHRIQGNESFRCGEYELAVLEYTKSLSYAPTATAYNNRAVTYLKQKMYDKAINDCNKCLKIEPTNVKALLRKCDALIACDRKNEAYQLYTKILQIDAENVTAKTALRNISIRLEIQDVNVPKPSMPRTYDRSLLMCENNGDENDDGHVYDGLIIPKRCA